jgi:hypothetical protein
VIGAGLTTCAVQLEVDRHDLRRTRLVDESVPEPIHDGDVVLRVDRYALTANNVSYALSGEAIGYWYFFPTADPWIRVPVMGHAEVVASAHPEVTEGRRVFGFFPMGTHLRVSAGPTGSGFADRSAHRADEPAVYRSFLDVEGPVDTDAADRSLLLRGLFLTSYLADDFLGEEGYLGATQVVVVSASSKTAIAFAHQARVRGGLEVVGVTSPGNAAFCDDTAVYDRVATYGDLSSVDPHQRTVVVDLSGDSAVVAQLHTLLASSVAHSMAIGATRWESFGERHDVPGPQPQFFFAPTQIARRTAEWGADGFARVSGEALDRFIAHSAGWLDVDVAPGAQAMAEAWADTVAGRVPPSVGRILVPGSPDGTPEHEELS